MRYLPTITEPVYPCPREDYAPGKLYAWHPRELQVLRERYLSEGLKGCVPLLPHRKAHNIIKKSNDLGLHRQKKPMRLAESNDMLDAAIRRLYLGGAPRGAVKAFCRQHGRTRGWVLARAKKIGAWQRGTNRGPGWTAEEEALLEQHCTRPIKTIAAIFSTNGFHRTASAIEYHRYLRGLDPKDPDKFSANELAALMGVDSHRVSTWIRHCGLKAKAMPDVSGGIKQWELRRNDVRAWLIRSAEWDHRKCQREWLIEMLAGRIGVSADAELGRFAELDRSTDQDFCDDMAQEDEDLAA